MPFVSGYLRIRDRGLHPEHGLPPGSPGAPDQGLPPDEGGEDPGYGYPESPVDPGWGLPAPPPGVWPPPTPAHPIIPAPPDTPPGAIWPPPRPAYPWAPPIGSPGAPDQGLPPGSPGAPAHPIEPVGPGPSHPIALPPGKFWIVAGIPGYGWWSVCVEPQPGHPIVYPPPAPAHPIEPPTGPAASPRR